MSYIDLMKYLPQYYQENAEMIQIQRLSLGGEIFTLNEDIPLIFIEGFVSTASSSRLSEWERDLGIAPAETIEERRENILSFFRRKGKLDEQTIKNIVALYYDNSECTVAIEDSVIKITVYPSHEEYVTFEKILPTINVKKPAHLGCTIAVRPYCTWGDIKEGFNTWNDVKNKGSWKSVKLYLPYI